MKKTYAHHSPSEQSLQRITELRNAFSYLDDLICKLTPLSREQSVALTKMEEAAMWAIKAVVVNDPESKVDIKPEPIELKGHPSAMAKDGGADGDAAKLRFNAYSAGGAG